MPQPRHTRRRLPVAERRSHPHAFLPDGIRSPRGSATRLLPRSRPWRRTLANQAHMPRNCSRPSRSRWRSAFQPHFFRPDCFRIVFGVAGAKSSPGLPGTVTRPGFEECLNWRWLPRVATRNHRSWHRRLPLFEVVRYPHSSAFPKGAKGANAEFRGTSRSEKCRDRGKANPGVFEHHLFGSGYAGLGNLGRADLPSIPRFPVSRHRGRLRLLAQRLAGLPADPLVHAALDSRDDASVLTSDPAPGRVHDIELVLALQSLPAALASHQTALRA